MRVFGLSILFLLVLQKVIPLNGQDSTEVSGKICCHDTWTKLVSPMAEALKSNFDKDGGKVSPAFMEAYTKWMKERDERKKIEDAATDTKSVITTDILENYCGGWFFLQCGAQERCECLEPGKIYEAGAGDKNNTCVGTLNAFCKPEWNLNCKEGLECKAGEGNKDIKFCSTGSSNELKLTMYFVIIVLLLIIG